MVEGYDGVVGLRTVYHLREGERAQLHLNTATNSTCKVFTNGILTEQTNIVSQVGRNSLAIEFQGQWIDVELVAATTNAVRTLSKTTGDPMDGWSAFRVPADNKDDSWRVHSVKLRRLILQPFNEKEEQKNEQAK